MTVSIAQSLFVRFPSGTTDAAVEFDAPTTIGNELIFVLISGANGSPPSIAGFQLVQQYTNSVQGIFVFSQIISEANTNYSFVINDITNIFGIEIVARSLSTPNVFFIDQSNRNVLNYVTPADTTQNIGLIFISTDANILNIVLSEEYGTPLNNFIGNDGYGNKAFGYVLNGNIWGTSVKSVLPTILDNTICSILLI